MGSVQYADDESLSIRALGDVAVAIGHRRIDDVLPNQALARVLLNRLRAEVAEYVVSDREWVWLQGAVRYDAHEIDEVPVAAVGPFLELRQRAVARLRCVGDGVANVADLCAGTSLPDDTPENWRRFHVTHTHKGSTLWVLVIWAWLAPYFFGS